MKGFSLVEVLVAMSLVVASALGMAELFAVATRVTQDARIDTTATFAAESKMAQLRALTLAWDADGASVTSPGLASSPATALTANTDGYVDYVDGSGAVVGAGVAPPPAGVFLRRWSIQPLPADPANAVVLQVVAARVTRPAACDAHLVSILARTSQ